MCDDVLGCALMGYDDLNRMTSLSGSGNLNFTYSYDRYGNRLSQNGSPSTSFLMDAVTNRNTSFAYDSAGNQTNDGNYSYTYDAEGNVTAVNSGARASYAYDALNQRVRSGDQNSSQEFVFDTFSHRVSSWLLGTGAAAGSGIEARIYWGDTLIANRSWNGQTYMHHPDWLGTERMRTDYLGNEANRITSYAFGDGFSQTSTDGAGAAQDGNYFAGQDFNGESGTDHATFRQYSPNAGRWMSPDPYDGSYDLSNPQSLNRYSYVNNNPFSATDPDGLFLGSGSYGAGSAASAAAGAACSVGGPLASIGCGLVANLFEHFFEAVFFNKPVFKGSTNPRPGARGGSTNDPWNESLGYPKGGPQLGGGWGVTGALGLPIDQGCEFGACGFQKSTTTSLALPSLGVIEYLSEFAAGVYVAVNTYNDMRHSHFIGQDKCFHCMAMCRASSAGGGGSDAAQILSIGREILDFPKYTLGIGQKKRLSPSATIQDSREDLGADYTGINGSPLCGSACSRYNMPGVTASQGCHR